MEYSKVSDPSDAYSVPPTVGVSHDAPLLEVKDVCKRIGGHTVLSHVNLTVSRGEVVGLIGPSGSGKSTLLRCIIHLENVDSGRIHVGGNMLGYEERKGRLFELSSRKVARRRASIGMVFQHFDLFNNKTALENVTEAPVVVNRKSKRAATLRARELLTTVGVAEKERSYPTQMSGGQQQRVAIARALAMEPQLLLLDEPTSALDPELVGGVLEIVGELAASGVTMILVTHEIGFAREVCDRVAFMDEGFIVESGIAQQVFTEPANPRTRAFLGKLL